MTEAQQLFDSGAGCCCPEQLSSPVLHKVLGYDPIAEHIWGGKGVGSQASASSQVTAAQAFTIVSRKGSQCIATILDSGLCGDHRIGLLYRFTEVFKP